MRRLWSAALSAAFVLAAFVPARAEVRLTMADGKVSIQAKDATLRQILTEWARVGQTKIVNLERVPGGPISLQLNDVPEGKALDTLLRTLSGYMAAPRRTPVANASRFDRIIVMTTVAAQGPATQAPGQAGRPAGVYPQPGGGNPFAPPQMPAPPAMPQPAPASTDEPQADDPNAPGRQAMPQPQFLGGPPGGMQLPGMMPQQPNGAAPGGVTVVGGAPTTVGGPGVGTATPGMVAQPPQPQGNQPQPRRPGGGV